MSLWLQNLYIYIYIYIYIYTDAPDINMLTNVFCFVLVCILLNQIPAPQMNPDVSSNCFPLSALYQHQMFNYCILIFYGKTSSLTTDCFFFLNPWKEAETLK